jgi:hypothetical protein
MQQLGASRVFHPRRVEIAMEMMFLTELGSELDIPSRRGNNGCCLIGDGLSNFVPMPLAHGFIENA